MSQNPPPSLKNTFAARAKHRLQLSLSDIARMQRATTRETGIPYDWGGHAFDFEQPEDEASKIVPTAWAWKQLQGILVRRYNSSLRQLAIEQGLTRPPRKTSRPKKIKTPPKARQEITKKFLAAAFKATQIVTQRGVSAGTPVFYIDNKKGQFVPIEDLNGPMIQEMLKSGRVIGLPAGTTVASFRDSLGLAKPLMGRPGHQKKTP